MELLGVAQKPSRLRAPRTKALWIKIPLGRKPPGQKPSPPILKWVNSPHNRFNMEPNEILCYHGK